MSNTNAAVREIEVMLCEGVSPVTCTQTEAQHEAGLATVFESGEEIGVEYKRYYGDLSSVYVQI